MSDRVRIFLCSFLNKLNMDYYYKLISVLQEEHNIPIRHVPKNSYHITHIFFGEIPRQNLDRLIHILETVNNIESCQITLERPCATLVGQYSRLIRADLLEMKKIQAQIQEKLIHHLRSNNFGLPSSAAKPPHVTLARFRRGTSKSVGIHTGELITQLFGDESKRLDCIRKLELIESTLTQDGPIYSKIMEVTL